MKFISRHFLAVVFENSHVINFLDLKTFELSASISVGSLITCIQCSLMPGSFESHQEQIARLKVDLETLNYRQPYLIVCDSDGQVHIINTSTLTSEHSFTVQEGKVGLKPILECFTSLYDCCFVSVDTDLYLRLHSIEKHDKFVLKRSYDLVGLIKKICSHASTVVSQLSLESSAINMRKLGQQHILLSISKTLHLFKITETFQLKHEATFVSSGGEIYPFESSQILEIRHRPGARRYIARSQKKDQEMYLTNVDTIRLPSMVFFVSGNFFEFELHSKKLHLIHQTRTEFSRLQSLENGYRQEIGSLWRILGQKCEGGYEVLEIARKNDHRVESGVVVLQGYSGQSVDCQVMDLRYRGGEEGVNLVIQKTNGEQGIKIQLYKFD